MIQSQFRLAEAVGSFNFWKEQGFHVTEGEKGIKVFVPNQTAPKFQDENGKWKNIKYTNEKEKEMMKKGSLEKQEGKLYFGIGHVFDVSQTSTKAIDLSEIFPYRWMEGDVEQYDTMFQSFERLAKDMGVSVGDPFGELGNTKGAFIHQ